MIDGLSRPIAAFLVQPDAGQGCHQFEGDKSLGTRFALAALQNGAAQPVARMLRIERAMRVRSRSSSARVAGRSR